MKKVAPGIWRDIVEGVEIMVDENLKTISTVLPENKVVKVDYPEIPTTDNYAVFRAGVEEAVWVLNRLKIS